MQEVSGVEPCAGAQRSSPFVALQTHFCFFFSFHNSINIHVQKLHRYGKCMQKSVVLPVQELPALFENSAESFHLSRKKKSSCAKKRNCISIFAFRKALCTPRLTSRMESVIECESENGLQ